MKMDVFSLIRGKKSNNQPGKNMIKNILSAVNKNILNFVLNLSLYRQ